MPAEALADELTDVEEVPVITKRAAGGGDRDENDPGRRT